MNRALQVALLRSWRALVRELKSNRDPQWPHGMPTWELWNEFDLVWHLARHLTEHAPRLPYGRLTPGCVHFEASLADRNDGTDFGGQRVDLAVLDVGAHGPSNWEDWKGLLFLEAKIVHRARSTRAGPLGPRQDADKLRRYLRAGVAAAGVLLVVDQRDQPLQKIEEEYRRLVRNRSPRLGALVFAQRERQSIELL